MMGGMQDWCCWKQTYPACDGRHGRSPHDRGHGRPPHDGREDAAALKPVTAAATSNNSNKQQQQQQLQQPVTTTSNHCNTQCSQIERQSFSRGCFFNAPSVGRRECALGRLGEILTARMCAGATRRNSGRIVMSIPRAMYMHISIYINIYTYM